MKKFAVLLAVLVCFAAPIETFAAKQEYNRFKVKRIVSKSKCFKCHAIERQKVGPAYISVSQKFGGDPDGRQKIYTHLTTSPEVEVEGKMENHVNLKTSGDGDINEVISWLLSLREIPKYKKYLTETSPAVESAAEKASAPAPAPAKASAPAPAPAKASAPAPAPARASAPAPAPAKESAPAPAPAKASASPDASEKEDTSSSSSDDDDTSWFEKLFESR